MKRIIAIILAALLCFVFVGCSGSGEKATDDSAETSVQDSATAKTEETSAQDSTDAKTEETSAQNSEAQKTDSDDSADSGSASAPATVYDTVEDYINAPDVKKSMESAKESSGDIISFDYHAEGNKLIYDYTYNNHIDDSELEAMKKVLEDSMESNSDYYTQVADVLKRNVKIDEPEIVINYHNDDGTVIATKSYK